MGERFTINSEEKWSNFVQWARKLYHEHKYITFDKPRIGPDRSIDQNSLFHVWATEYVAHLLSKSKKRVTKGELVGMKREIKKRFYLEFRHPWMTHKIVNPKTGEQKPDYTSSADWSHEQMYTVLSWLQVFALTEDNLILESRGKFAKEQREAQA